MRLYEVIMLCAEDDGIDALRCAVHIILQCHLSLSIRTKVGHKVRLLLADLG